MSIITNKDDKPNINDIREGVAGFSQAAGISQVEAACEIALMLATIVHNMETAGASFEVAVENAAKDFEVRWPKVFE